MVEVAFGILLDEKKLTLESICDIIYKKIKDIDTNFE